MNMESNSYIDEAAGKFVLRSADGKGEWIISEDSILISKGRPEREGMVIPLSEVTGVKLNTKKTFIYGEPALFVNSTLGKKAIANAIYYDTAELDIFEKAHSFISGYMELANSAPEKQRSFIMDKRPEGDKSYIDAQIGHIFLRSHNYQSAKKKGKEWVVSGGSITVHEYGLGARSKTYSIAQISKMEMDKVDAKSLFGQIKIYINSGKISAIGGTTLESKPDEFIHYYAYEHDIALKVRDDIKGKASAQPPATRAALGSASQAVPASIADELLKLKGLLDDGVLTQEEFNQAKKKLLEL